MVVTNKELEEKIQTQLKLQEAEVLGYVKRHSQGVFDKQLVAEFTRRGWVESVIQGCLTDLLATRRLLRTRWRIFVPLTEELLTVFADRKWHSLTDLYREFSDFYFESVRLSCQILVEQRRLTMNHRGRLRLRSVI